MIVTSILHRLFLLAPTLPLNYPYIVTFHLVSGDLQGGNNRNKLLKCNVVYTLLFALFEKEFFWLWPEQKRKKPVLLCNV